MTVGKVPLSGICRTGRSAQAPLVAFFFLKKKKERTMEKWLLISFKFNVQLQWVNSHRERSFFTCKSVFQTRCVGGHQDTSGSGAGALCGELCALAIREDGLAIDVRDIVGTADAV